VGRVSENSSPCVLLREGVSRESSLAIKEMPLCGIEHTGSISPRNERFQESIPAGLRVTSIAAKMGPSSERIYMQTERERSRNITSKQKVRDPIEGHHRKSHTRHIVIDI